VADLLAHRWLTYWLTGGRLVSVPLGGDPYKYVYIVSESTTPPVKLIISRMFSASSVLVALLFTITTTGTTLTSTRDAKHPRYAHYARGCETLLERREW